MGKICFIIQPFDKGEYDKRYRETYLPAIEASGFTAYRVDEDTGASIPILEIESRIAKSDVCFADISVDNPNVWFEVGLAIAHKKEMCLVCNKSRSNLPFDVRHRQVLFYSTTAPSDFIELQAQIEKRIQAISLRLEEMANLPNRIVHAESTQSDLSIFEIAVIGVIASEQAIVEDRVRLYDIRQAVDKQGFTPLAANAGLKMLVQKKIVSSFSEREKDGAYTSSFALTEAGWEWVSKNMERFHVSKNDKQEENADLQVFKPAWAQDKYFLEIDPKSTEMTTDDARALLSRIDEKSVLFLERIVQNGGVVTWPEMRKIFGIKGCDWSACSAHQGKGITNAFRNVINGTKSDKLVVWSNTDPAWHDRSWHSAKVYITGLSLMALTRAFEAREADARSAS